MYSEDSEESKCPASSLSTRDIFSSPPYPIRWYTPCMPTGGGKHAQSNDNYSIGKAMLRRLVKEAPPLCAITCISSVLLVFMTVMIIIYSSKSHLAFAGYTIDGDILTVRSKSPFFLDHTSSINELVIVTQRNNIVPAPREWITRDIFVKLLKHNNSIIIVRSQNSSREAGTISLKGLSLNQRDRYWLIGIYAPSETDNMYIAYNVDISDEIHKYAALGGSIENSSGSVPPPGH